MPNSQPLVPAESPSPVPTNGHARHDASALPGVGDIAAAAATRQRPLPPLRVSATVGGWALSLALVGAALLLVLLANLAEMVARYGPGAWTIDLMILLACVPVVVAVVWIVRRTVAAAAADFVRGVSATPLLEIVPPPRPRSLASPLATLRAAGLLPLLAGVVVLAALVAAADGWALSTGDATLVVGSVAVTAGGVAMLAALLLTLSASLRQVERAVAAREREVGAHFYALAVSEPAADDTSGTYAAVCAVPAPL